MSEHNDDVSVEIDVAGDNVDVEVNQPTQDTPDISDQYGYLLPEEIEAINTDEADTDPQEPSDGDSDKSDNDRPADTDRPATTDTDRDGRGDDKSANPATNDGDKPADTVDYNAKLASFAERQADIDARFEANLQAIRDLGDKYNDGDVSEGEYQAELARLQREGRKLDYEEQTLINQQSQVQTQSDVTEAQIQAEFQRQADEFLARDENAVFMAGSPELTALDQQLQILATTLPPTTPFNVLFDKARAVVATYMDLPALPTDKAGETDATVKVTVKPKQPDIPPNLGMMPSAVSNSSMGKFVHLDKLEGVEFDQAFSRLSEAEQNEYLRGA